MSDEQSPPPSSPAEEKGRRPPAEPIPKVNREGDKNLGGGPKYELDNPGKIGSQMVGDGNKQENNYYGDRFDGNIHININTPLDNYVKKISGEDESNKVAARQFVRKLADIFQDEQKDQRSPTPPSIPKNEEEISHWYSGLTSYDQCFVQAMAIFSGATIPEISFATNRLYEPVAEAVRERARYIPQAGEAAMPLPLPQKLEAPDGSSLFERMRRTYVKIERSNSAECFLWQDVDKDGISRFQILLLHFLARSAYMWSDSIFLEQLKAWVESLEDDNSILALTAQGIIWGHYPGELSAEVIRWSNSDAWYRASGLLYGAYIAEYIEDPARANDFQSSFVLKTIFKWVRKARQKANGRKGQAAALAYMLLGTHTLALALRGLDSLLELPQGRRMIQRQEAIQGQANDDDDDDDDDEEDWEFAIAQETFDGTVNAYNELATMGYAEEILRHLAKQVEQSSHYRIALTEMKYDERYYHRIQRNLTLIACFTVFFAMARRSLHNLKYKPWVNYDPSVPPTQPATLYNTDEREILLVGLLHGSWCREIQTLICATLMEKNLGDYHNIGLDLLRRWADLVLKDQSPHPDQVRKAYVQFLVEIGQMIPSWCRYWVDLGFTAPSALHTYRNRLEQWQRDGLKKNLPIAGLAQEVLKQLPMEQSLLLTTYPET